MRGFVGRSVVSNVQRRGVVQSMFHTNMSGVFNVKPILAMLKFQLESAIKDACGRMPPSTLPEEVRDIDVGSKIIGSRVMWSRLSGALEFELNNPIKAAERKLGTVNLKAAIKGKQINQALTSHPTEGQPLEVIVGKVDIVEILTIQAKIMVNSKPSPQDLVGLKRIAINNGLEVDINKDKVPNYRRSIAICKSMCQTLVERFIEGPIHHVKKMTQDQERAITLFHLNRNKKMGARIQADFPEYVLPENFEYDTWVEDADGRKYKIAGDASKFYFDAQRYCFKSLLEQLEDFADLLDFSGKDSSVFRSQVIDEILEMCSSVSKRLLIRDEADLFEQKIDKVLAEYALNDQAHLIKAYSQIRNYIALSGCKIYYNCFSSREEIALRLKADKDVQTLLLTYKGSGSDNEILARNFDKLDPETKRLAMRTAEHAILNHRCKDIISQFDSNLSSYKTVQNSFELFKQLPQYHEEILYFKKHYMEVSKVAGFDIYAQLFTDEGIRYARESLVQISPLVETKDDIARFPKFSQERVADPECLEYMKKSGNIVRATGSYSDGVEALGAHMLTQKYLESDGLNQELAASNDLIFAKKWGIGNADPDRMAQWSTRTTPMFLTVQGSDAQNQTIELLAHLLLKDPDRSIKQWRDLKATYPEEDINKLTEFYHNLYKRTEFGVRLEHAGVEFYLGKWIHRCTEQEESADALGNLSARPATRTGEKKKAKEVTSNTLGSVTSIVPLDNIRKIGMTNGERVSVITSFLSSFYRFPPNVDSNLLADYHLNDQMMNTIMTVFSCLGTADYKSLLRVNGISNNVTSEELLDGAARFENFQDVVEAKGITETKEVMNCANLEGFGSAPELRKGAVFYHIFKAKSVLRNALTPLIFYSDQEVKDEALNLMEQVENDSDLLRNYGEYVIKACDILVNDPSQDIATRKAFTCVAQQVFNVTKPNHYFDARKRVGEFMAAAITNGEVENVHIGADLMSRITRSSSNPLGNGGVTELRFEYIRDNTVEPAVNIDSLCAEIEREKDADALHRSAMCM